MHNKALIGTIIIAVVFIGNVLYIGKKNLWFEPKNKYWTVLKYGEGLRDGTLVTFNGIKMGEVSDLTVNDDNMIEVRFYVRQSLAEKISADSRVRVTRSMMIGDKRLEVMPGARGAAPLKSNSYIPGEDVRELSDLLSGGEQLQRMMPQLIRLLNNIDIITTSVAENPDLIGKVGKIMDEAFVLLKTVERSWLFKGSYKEFQQEQQKRRPDAWKVQH
jgi:phospholipid/cholesterol/gamma-HCH transport system substrate-binding protein